MDGHPNQKHLKSHSLDMPLSTSMVTRPTLQDVLEEAILSVERDVWDNEMQGLSEEQHSRMSEEDMEKLDRTFATEPITRISRILETLPRLRELLNQSYQAYELPEYVMVEINGAAEAQSDHIVQSLTDIETTGQDDHRAENTDRPASPTFVSQAQLPPRLLEMHRDQKNRPPNTQVTHFTTSTGTTGETVRNRTDEFQSEHDFHEKDDPHMEWKEEEAVANFLQKLERADPELAREVMYWHEPTTEPSKLSWVRGTPQDRKEKLTTLFRTTTEMAEEVDAPEMDQLVHGVQQAITHPLKERVKDLTHPDRRMTAAFEPDKHSHMMDVVRRHLSHQMSSLQENLKEYLSRAQPWQIDEQDKFEIVETNLQAMIQIERDIDLAQNGHKPDSMPLDLQREFDAVTDSRTQILHFNFKAFMTDRYRNGADPDNIHNNNYLEVTHWEQFKEDFQEFTQNHLPGDTHRLALEIAIASTVQTRENLFGLSDPGNNEEYITAMTTKPQP